MLKYLVYVRELSIFDLSKTSNMKSFTELLASKGVKTGATIELYYSNGRHYADTMITRVSDYFVFHNTDPNPMGDCRDSYTTILRRLKEGTMRIKK